LIYELIYVFICVFIYCNNDKITAFVIDRTRYKNH